MTGGLFRLFGISIHAITPSEAADRVSSWARGSEQKHIVAANTHVLMESRRDPEYRKALEEASLIVPDGMPLVWMARRKGVPIKQRVYGPDLMADVLKQTSAGDVRHYFYGGREETLAQLTKKIKTEFPSIAICGYQSPPFRDLTAGEETEAIERINAARPHILWVGLGCPRQELWISRTRRALRIPVLAGVGQAFDLLSGSKKRAPKWMQQNGLEWFFRLCQEPGRLWKRYLIYGPAFILACLAEECKRKGEQGC